MSQRAMTDTGYPGAAIKEFPLILRPQYPALATNSSALTAIASKAPVALDPATDFDPRSRLWRIPSSLATSVAATGRAFLDWTGKRRKVMEFVITNADNEQAQFRAWDWNLEVHSDTVAFMVPSPAFDLTATAGSRAHGNIANGFYADTLAVTNINRPAGDTVEVFSRVANDIARLEVPTIGAQLLEIEGTVNGVGTPGVEFQIFAGDR